MIFEIIFVYVLWKRGLAAAILLYLSLYVILALMIAMYFIIANGALNGWSWNGFPLTWKEPAAVLGIILAMGVAFSNGRKERAQANQDYFLQQARLIPPDDKKALDYRPGIRL